MLKDEPANRMITYRGESGKVVWDKSITYGGPCLLHHRTIITQNGALDFIKKPVNKEKLEEVLKKYGLL